MTEDNEDINHHYTDQERVSLTEYIIQAHKEIMDDRQKQGRYMGYLGLQGLWIGDKCAWDMLCLRTISPKSWATLRWTPLENMPLFINDSDLYTRGVARWRLNLGR